MVKLWLSGKEAGDSAILGAAVLIWSGLEP